MPDLGESAVYGVSPPPRDLFTQKQKSRPVGVPTVKQLYIELKKDEKILVLFAHYLACKV